VIWLAFSDLAERKRLPKTWMGINRLIRDEGFPPGRMVGRNRIWREKDVDEWLLSRPTDKSFLRGRARTLVEGARPPEISKPGPSVDAEGTGHIPSKQQPSIPDSAPAAQEDALW
jgi:hypothetical protein